MSRATTSPVTEPAGIVPAAGDGLPLTPAEVIRRGMAEAGRRIRRYEVDFDTGEVRILYAQPDAAELSDLARDILEALGETPDDWVESEEVCRRIGGGLTAGRSYYRAVAELKRLDRVESSTQRGVRLKS